MTWDEIAAEIADYADYARRKAEAMKAPRG